MLADQSSCELPHSPPASSDLPLPVAPPYVLLPSQNGAWVSIWDKKGFDKEAGQGGEESSVINKSSHSNLYTQAILADFFFSGIHPRAKTISTHEQKRNVQMETKFQFLFAPRIDHPSLSHLPMTCYPYPI